MSVAQDSFLVLVGVFVMTLLLSMAVNGASSRGANTPARRCFRGVRPTPFGRVGILECVRNHLSVYHNWKMALDHMYPSMNLRFSQGSLLLDLSPLIGAE